MKSLLKVFSLVALFIGMILMPAHAEVPKAELPLIITSCGQSPDALMIKLLADQIRLDSVFEKTLEPDQVEGFKTLIIGIGGSVKGLGEAGIDTDEEIGRVNRVIAKARSQGMLVIAMHTGGEPRRGDLADPFIHAAAPQVDFLVVRNDGNKDGLFTRIANDSNIPILYIEQTMEVKGVLEQLFADEL